MSEAHGGPHVMSIKALLATWGALMVLTGMTVAAVWVDLGARINLSVALAVAVVKAAIVCAFFMHLYWDKKFNLLILMGALMAVALFISVVFIDAGAYQPAIRAVDNLSTGAH